MTDSNAEISNVDANSAGHSASAGVGGALNTDTVGVRVRDGGGQRPNAPVGAGVAGELHFEISEAQALLASMADILGDDADLASATVEGETNLVEAMNRAVNRVVELDGMISGIGAMMDAANERLGRIKRQRERIRELICIAMETANMKKLETPIATVSLKKLPPSLVVTNEAEIPTRFWKTQEPTLDKRALLAALKDEPIAGAQLSNGGQTISFKAN